LYDTLGENHILIGLAAKLSSTFSKEVQLALDAEICGNYTEAIKIYSHLNKATEASKLQNQEEIDLWNDRSLSCMNQLCDWQQLYFQVETLSQQSIASDKTEISGKKLFNIMSNLSSTIQTENSIKERFMPYYITCLFNDSEREEEYEAFLDNIMTHQPNQNFKKEKSDPLLGLKNWVEAKYSIEIASCFVAKKKWPRALQFINLSYSQFLEKWATIHPCANQARKFLLQKLQRIVELEDTVEFYSSSNKSDSYSNINNLLFKWRISQPSIADSITHWSNVCRVRHKSLLGKSLDNIEPANKNSVLHVANFHVLIAIAAVHQGILDAVKPQLSISNALRKTGISIVFLKFY
jgi:hypothetical protein